VLLVGGSSRIPLVSKMVTAELKRPTSVDTHPKHAIALGAAAHHAHLVAEERLAQVPDPADADVTDDPAFVYRAEPRSSAVTAPPARSPAEPPSRAWGGATEVVERVAPAPNQPPRFGAGDAPPSLTSASGQRTPTPKGRYALLLVLLVAVAAGAAFVLFRPAVAGVTRPNSARVTVTTARVGPGESYFAVASGYSAGEQVRFTWIGPTSGDMGSFPADSAGTVVHGPIIERDPPGDYQIIVTGRTSGNVAATPLKVVAGATGK
jgi:hypothetical protein